MKNLLNILLITTFSIFILSCPEPISQEVLNQAEDTYSPRISVSGPDNNDIYYSETTVTGTVSDDAIENGDSQGVIDSFSFEILYDADRRGGIVREGGTYVMDTDVGTGVVSYTPATGAFEFTVSTITPSVLTGQVTLRMTATDSNGNTTISDLKLLESNGPVISLVDPGTTVTEFDTGDDIPISGTVVNSNQDSGADQISRISWNANNAITGDLTLDGSDGTFTSNTSQGITLSYNTSTTAFSSILRVSDTTTGFYVITVEAEDFNGHVTTVSRTIYREGAGPDFDFTGSTNTLASSTYLRKDAYSPFPIEITFDDYTEVTSLKYQGKSNAGDPALDEVTLSPLPSGNTYTFTPNYGTYFTEIQGWLATTEVLQLYVTAENAEGEESVHLLNMMLDSQGPTVSIDGISGTNAYNGNTYATDGTKTIDFSYSDSYSGMDDITLSITGQTVSNVDPPTTSYDQIFTTGTDGGTVTFTLSADDVAGNTSTATQNVIFYFDDPTISWDDITSGGNSYAASGDTITLEFSSDHVLDTLPTAQINGVSATVARVDDTNFTAEASLSSGSRIDNVGISIDSVTDAAGISLSSPYTASTTLIYDPVAPVISTVSSSPTAGSSLQKNDSVTVTWNASTDGETEIASVSFDFSELGGGAVAGSLSGGSWSATFTVTDDDVETTDADVLITATDLAGNSNSTPYEHGSWIIDTTPPTITTANISLSGSSGTAGTYTTGDTVTCTWDAAADGNTDIASVDFDFSDFGGGTVQDTSSTGGWSATYTLVSGSIDATSAVVEVSASDTSGNDTSSNVDSSQAKVDTETPSISLARISVNGASGTGGTFITGDTVSCSWSATADGDTDIDSVDFDFSDFGGGSVSGTFSSGSWSASYTLIEGSIDTTTAVVSLTAEDDAGLTDIQDSNQVSVDTDTPEITLPNISVSGASGSGGEFLAGDTVTVTWDAASDGFSDIDSVEFDFSDFGGGTQTDSSSTGGWSSTYTLLSGSIESAAAVISLTAEDDAGLTSSSSDSSNQAVDNQLPTITGGSVNITDTSIIVTFSEAAYSAADGSGDLVAADFDISISGTGATDASITSVSHTEGDSSATLTISYTGTQTADNDIIITPADGASVYDQAGNPMDAAQTTGTIDLTGS